MCESYGYTGSMLHKGRYVSPLPAIAAVNPTDLEFSCIFGQNDRMKSGVEFMLFIAVFLGKSRTLVETKQIHILTQGPPKGS